jgi:hypothetical protein
MQFDASVNDFLTRIFMLIDIDNSGSVDLIEYSRIFELLHKILWGKEAGGYKAIRQRVRKKFFSDTAGAKMLDQVHFKQAWLQLTATWAKSHSAADYIHFLKSTETILTRHNRSDHFARTIQRWWTDVRELWGQFSSTSDFQQALLRSLSSVRKLASAHEHKLDAETSTSANQVAAIESSGGSSGDQTNAEGSPRLEKSIYERGTTSITNCINRRTPVVIPSPPIPSPPPSPSTLHLQSGVPLRCATGIGGQTIAPLVHANTPRLVLAALSGESSRWIRPWRTKRGTKGGGLLRVQEGEEQEAKQAAKHSHAMNGGGGSYYALPQVRAFLEEMQRQQFAHEQKLIGRSKAAQRTYSARKLRSHNERMMRQQLGRKAPWKGARMEAGARTQPTRTQPTRRLMMGCGSVNATTINTASAAKLARCKTPCRVLGPPNNLAEAAATTNCAAGIATAVAMGTALSDKEAGNGQQEVYGGLLKRMQHQQRREAEVEQGLVLRHRRHERRGKRGRFEQHKHNDNKQWEATVEAFLHEYTSNVTAAAATTESAPCTINGSRGHDAHLLNDEHLLSDEHLLRTARPSSSPRQYLQSMRLLVNIPPGVRHHRPNHHQNHRRNTAVAISGATSTTTFATTAPSRSVTSEGAVRSTRYRNVAGGVHGTRYSSPFGSAYGGPCDGEAHTAVPAVATLMAGSVGNGELSGVGHVGGMQSRKSRPHYTLPTVSSEKRQDREPCGYVQVPGEGREKSMREEVQDQDHDQDQGQEQEQEQEQEGGAQQEEQEEQEAAEEEEAQEEVEEEAEEEEGGGDAAPTNIRMPLSIPLGAGLISPVVNGRRTPSTSPPRVVIIASQPVHQHHVPTPPNLACRGPETQSLDGGVAADLKPGPNAAAVPTARGSGGVARVPAVCVPAVQQSRLVSVRATSSKAAAARAAKTRVLVAKRAEARARYRQLHWPVRLEQVSEQASSLQVPATEALCMRLQMVPRPHRSAWPLSALRPPTATRTMELRNLHRQRRLHMPAPQQRVHEVHMAATAAGKERNLEQVILAQAMSPIQPPLSTTESRKQWQQRREEWRRGCPRAEGGKNRYTFCLPPAEAS